MFNLFKKQDKPVAWTQNTPTQSNKEVVVIEMIHNEFDTAVDRLLLEAKDIISKMDMSIIDKGDRLSKLGFISTEDARIAAKQIREKAEKEELSKHIMYYKTWYPNHKFINEVEVKRICNKWGLVHGPARYYKGSVPDKNVREIESFKLRNEDKIKQETAVDVYKMGGKEYSGQNWHNHLSQFVTGVHGLSLGVDYTKDRVVLNTSYYQRPFEICAPEKDFDMTYLEKSGHRLEVKDPIVLQPVNGGYLIVTKWGIEAQDEGLINETHN